MCANKMTTYDEMLMFLSVSLIYLPTIEIFLVVDAIIF